MKRLFVAVMAIFILTSVSFSEKSAINTPERDPFTFGRISYEGVGEKRVINYSLPDTGIFYFEYQGKSFANALQIFLSENRHIEVVSMAGDVNGYTVIFKEKKK